jgi:hypothetical protein
VKLTSRGSILLLGVLLTSCASLFDRVSYLDMKPRLQYQGFSFARPPNPYWYFLRSEEEYTSVTLRRDLSPATPTHSFYAIVSLGGLERDPQSHDDFAELARSKGQHALYEVTTVYYEQSLITKQGQWCIRFDSRHNVRGAPVAPDQELVMNMAGFRCRHPYWPRTTLDFFYSERGLPNELDPKLAEEGEEFLKGVSIDVAPGTPAS